MLPMKDYNGLRYTKTFQEEKSHYIHSVALKDRVYTIAHDIYYGLVAIVTLMFTVMVLF